MAQPANRRDLSVRITLHLDAAAYGSLTVHAEDTGTPMAEYLRRALEFYFILCHVPPAADGPSVFGFHWFDDDWAIKYPPTVEYPPQKLNFYLPITMLQRAKKLSHLAGISLEEYFRRATVTYLVLERMAEEATPAVPPPPNLPLNPPASPLAMHHLATRSSQNVLTFPHGQPSL